MYLFSDATNCYSDNMSEHVDMVEVATEPNKSVELFFVSQNTNVVANYSSNNRSTTESKKSFIL